MHLSRTVASGLLGSRGSSRTGSPGTALLRSGLTGGDGVGFLLLAQPLVERANTLALDDLGSDVCGGGIFDLSAASRRASEASGSRGLRKLGGLRGSDGGGQGLTLLLRIGRSIVIINHLVHNFTEWRTTFPLKELARLDGVTRQRLNTVQDLIIVVQQVGASSEQAQLVFIFILIFVVETVDNFLATAAKKNVRSDERGAG